MATKFWQQKGSLDARRKVPRPPLPIEDPEHPRHDKKDRERPNDQRLYAFLGNWAPIPPFKPTGMPGLTQRWAICLHLTGKLPPKVKRYRDYPAALREVRRSLVESPPSYREMAALMPDTASKGTAKDRLRRGLEKLGYSLSTSARFRQDVKRLLAEENLRVWGPAVAELARMLGLLPIVEDLLPSSQ
jgi:hypothetical protein